MPEEKELTNLLGKLCVTYGFCLPSLANQRLIKFPPKTAEKFVKSVVEAEGLTIETVDKTLYRSMLSETESIYN